AGELRGRLGEPPSQPREVDLERGERLPELIVDLARDARALRFPGRLAPDGEVAQLLAVAVQLLLRAPALGEVLDHPHEQARRAPASAAPRSAMAAASMSPVTDASARKVWTSARFSVGVPVANGPSPRSVCKIIKPAINAVAVALPRGPNRTAAHTTMGRTVYTYVTGLRHSSAASSTSSTTSAAASGRRPAGRVARAH